MQLVIRSDFLRFNEIGAVSCSLKVGGYLLEFRSVIKYEWNGSRGGYYPSAVIVRFNRGLLTVKNIRSESQIKFFLTAIFFLTHKITPKVFVTCTLIKLRKFNFPPKLIFTLSANHQVEFYGTPPNFAWSIFQSRKCCNNIFYAAWKSNAHNFVLSLFL